MGVKFLTNKNKMMKGVIKKGWSVKMAKWNIAPMLSDCKKYRQVCFKMTQKCVCVVLKYIFVAENQ
jgi:hypothetical protein